jgi:hypothetical protein
MPRSLRKRDNGRLSRTFLDRFVRCCRAADDGAYDDLSCTEPLSQKVAPIPSLASAAAIQIEGRPSLFGKRVAGQVRFGQQIQSGHAPGRGRRAARRKMMPLRLTEHTQFEPGHDGIARSLQLCEVCEQSWVAARRVDQPFRAGLEFRSANGTLRVQYRRRSRWAGPIHVPNSAVKSA